MTDKQIIIDGVDVSGCKHYKNRTCIADYCLTDMPFGEAKCELNPNCYYKQLKRKEQECEELKEKYLELKEQNGSFIVQLNTANERLDQLKAENDTLFKAIEQVNKINKKLKAENRELKAVHSTNVALSDELFKYKAENDKLKEARKNSRCAWKSLEDTLCPEAQEQLDKLKQTLTEIKSILELYANSKVGEEQPDGTYQLSSGIDGSFGFGFGVCTTTYDPRPARQALQKISEVEE